MKDRLKEYFIESGEIKRKFIQNNIELLNHVINLVVNCYENGNKILIAGNGGSAADAQHWAAEMVGRYKKERKSLPAISLSTDTSILTAIGNDYGYDQVFAKQIEGLGKKGDIFFAISTSGNSENLLKALQVAKDKGLITIGLTGKGGGKLNKILDYNLIVPSDNTPRIQEVHLCIYHTICEELEKALFPE